jgi:hypothetical protein
MLRLEDFLIGFVCGIVVASIIGWLWGIYSRWAKERDAIRKPLDSKGTTAQAIYRTSLRAETQIWTARLVLLVFAWLALELFLPGPARFVRQTISLFFASLFG